MQERPKPPDHLRPDTAAWFADVVDGWTLDGHHVRLLTAACEVWDRYQEARETLARDGMTVAGREGGVRAHPCVAIERDARLQFARLIRELDLDCGAPAESRPPAIASNRWGVVAVGR